MAIDRIELREGHSKILLNSNLTRLSNGPSHIRPKLSPLTSYCRVNKSCQQLPPLVTMGRLLLG